MNYILKLVQWDTCPEGWQNFYWYVNENESFLYEDSIDETIIIFNQYLKEYNAEYIEYDKSAYVKFFDEEGAIAFSLKFGPINI